MKAYTVTVAYYDTWNEQTLVVEAGSVEVACAKAIDIADGERVDHYRPHSWDPGATFVAGIQAGGNLDNNEGLDNVIDGPIPFEHSEEAACGAGALHDALKAALPELESALEQRERSGNGETIERLCAIVAQVRSAIGADQQ